MTTENYAWRGALRQAIRRNRRDAHNRYLQLATVRADGSPAVRSLVFRDFCEDSDRLHMVTDARSDKVSDIGGRSDSEICWYFTHTREQFRLRGTLALRGADDDEQTLRQRLWDALSQQGREQFYWPHPGQPIGDGPIDPRDLAESPPATFLALSMRITSVDHLCLRGEPQRRFRSWSDSPGKWHTLRVNP